MSFASLLAQMKKGKAPSQDIKTTPSPNKNIKPSATSAVKKSSLSASQSTLHNTALSQPLKIDPAVARLKAARLAEREALLQKKLQQRKGGSPKVVSTHRKISTPKLPSISKKEQLQQQIKQDHQLDRPQKKLSYKELMQQAAKVDNSKMAITIKSKKVTSEPPIIRLKSNSEQRKKSASPQTTTKPESRITSHSPQRKNPTTKRRPVEYEEDLSDFISDEEGGELDYHLEILNIFGRKRQYDYDDYDDSSDDMEATGADILNEESKSSRIARLEEEREAELERRKKLEKLKRLKR